MLFRNIRQGKNLNIRSNMARNIFIAATRQNKGKTMVALGLIQALKKRFSNIGFIKPVGQRYVEVDGHKVDEDSVLVEKVCGLDCRLRDMSPVAVESDFTVKYISHPNAKKLISRIKSSYKKISLGKDIVVIEGTGHAGVGSVFDLSNASVARLLGSEVILVSSGGIGLPIDEIMLNKALFEAKGVKILGAIVNKVYPQKYDKVLHYVRKGLERKGIELLGVIPYEKVLSSPTIGEVMEETGAKLINGKGSLEGRVEEIVVGAMTAHQALGYFHKKTLVITPGDREDLILGAMSSSPAKGDIEPGVGGIVLTGNIPPHKNIMRLIKKTSIPVIALTEDTYSVASKIHDIIIKIRPSEREKIRIAVDLVERYVDIDRILEKI